MTWTITSPAFADGERIPAKYTADGEDISPPLDLGDVPEGAVELALICDDPDASGGTWTHWVLYELSPDVEALPEGGRYLGFVFAQGPEPDQVEESLREAHRRLEIVIDE